jgi:hypothetical protein
MNEETQNLKIIIDELNITADQKQGLLTKLEKDGVTEALLVEVKGHLSAMAADIQAKYPEESAQREILIKEIAESDDKAEADFNKQVENLDSQVTQLNKSLSNELDGLEIEDQRKHLK